MRRRTRHVIAVMVVATALCADRGAVVASAHARPHARPEANRSLASRLTSGLKQSIAPAAPLLSVRTSENVRSFPLPIGAGASGVRSEFSPFQFRLPPPSL